MTARYVVRKLGQAFVTVIAIVLLNFVLFRMMPGSPERATKNPHLTPEFVAAERARYGLDKPLFPDQLVAFVESTATGDLGYSIKYRGQPVTEVVMDAAGPTVLLIGLGEALAIVIGLWLGSRSAGVGAARIDRVGNALSLIFYSMPYFVIGMPLIIIFAAGLGWFPTSGMTTPGGDKTPVEAILDLAHHLVLPLTAVTLGLVGAYSILMRSSIIETRSEDYITTARAKGLPDGRILRSHAFPNALLPMVTLIAINLGYVVAGAITAEIVFNWPGLGTAHRPGARRARLPVAPGDLPVDRGVGGLRELRGRHRLRLSRSAGAGVSVTGLAGHRARGRALDGRGPPGARLHVAAPRARGRAGRADDPRVLQPAGALPVVLRRSAPERPVGDRPAARSRRAPPTRSGRTSSGGTS